MHCVYVLGSLKDGNLYTGSCRDIKARLAEHNAGRVPATSLRRPLELLYCELHASRKDAMQRETYLKTGWGRNYLERSIPDTLKIFRSKFRRV
ncbi:GIY-YIG nuclease family protein [Candidatus Kaiserbacteria bacterium]|nr:GIY-YIG nuclease family protein [Candidatus Kaiserbacteria bacterium]